MEKPEVIFHFFEKYRVTAVPPKRSRSPIQRGVRIGGNAPDLNSYRPTPERQTNFGRPVFVLIQSRLC